MIIEVINNDVGNYKNMQVGITHHNVSHDHIKYIIYVMDTPSELSIKQRGRGAGGNI